MARPANTARWAETGAGVPSAEIAEPASGTKDTGWLDGQKPPHNWFNWWMWQVFQWIKWISTKVPGIDEINAWTARQDFNAGVHATNTATAPAFTATGAAGQGDGANFTAGAGGYAGLQALGTGAGPGASVTGGGAGAAGSIQGAGLVGTGGTAGGPGAYGIGAAGNSEGVIGQGQGTAPGVLGAGGATGPGGKFTAGTPAGPTRGNINLGPVTATPSAPADGDMWIENVAGTWHLKVRMNGVTSTIV